MARDPGRTPPKQAVRPNTLGGPAVVPNVLRGTGASPVAPGVSSLTQGSYGPGTGGMRPARRPAWMPGRRSTMVGPGSVAPGTAATAAAHPSDFRTDSTVRYVWRLALGVWTALLVLTTFSEASIASEIDRIVIAVVLVAIWWWSLPVAGAFIRGLSRATDPLARPGLGQLLVRGLVFLAALVLVALLQLLVLGLGMGG